MKIKDLILSAKNAVWAVLKGELEEQLPGNFVRISNSEIVNVDKIIRLDMNLAGTIKVHLEGNMESNVSRRYLPKVRGVLM